MVTAGCLTGTSATDEVQPTTHEDEEPGNGTELRSYDVRGRFVDAYSIYSPVLGVGRSDHGRAGASNIFLENTSVVQLDIQLEWSDDLPRASPSKWRLAYGVAPNNVVYPEWVTGTSPLKISLNQTELEPVSPAYFYPIIRSASDQPFDAHYHETMWWNATVTWDPTINATHYEPPDCEDTCT